MKSGYLCIAFFAKFDPKLLCFFTQKKRHDPDTKIIFPNPNPHNNKPRQNNSNNFSITFHCFITKSIVYRLNIKKATSFAY